MRLPILLALMSAMFPLKFNFSWNMQRIFLTYLLLDSFSCANGICENNCRSTIRQSFRSN